MVEYSQTGLDRTFAALADPTRRAMLARLSDSALSVTKLAEPFPISLQAAMKHLDVLSEAGLVTRSKAGRTVTCTLAPENVERAARWLSERHRIWTERLDRFESYVPRELVLTRTITAPRSLIWDVWTNPEHVTQWWGPNGFTTPVYEADLRPGGKLVVHMRAPDGTVYPQAGTFEEVVPGERLVTVGSVEMNGSVAFVARTVVTFEDEGESTRVTIRQTYTNVTPAANDATAGAPIGWGQQFDRLDVYLRDLQG